MTDPAQPQPDEYSTVTVPTSGPTYTIEPQPNGGLTIKLPPGWRLIITSIETKSWRELRFGVEPYAPGNL